jgi:hypothetical protein
MVQGWDIEHDADGNLYTIDRQGSGVLVYNPGGQFIRHINGSTFSDIALDAAGNIYGVFRSNIITVIAPDGTQRTIAAVNPTSSHGIDADSIAVDAMGDIYVGDGLGAVVKLDPAGNYIKTIGIDTAGSPGPIITSPTSIAIDDTRGLLYYENSNMAGGNIAVTDLSGNVIGSLSTPLGYITSIAVEPTTGEIIVSGLGGVSVYAYGGGLVYHDSDTGVMGVTAVAFNTFWENLGTSLALYGPCGTILSPTISPSISTTPTQTATATISASATATFTSTMTSSTTASITPSVTASATPPSCAIVDQQTPDIVIGQADFVSGAINRGGSVSSLSLYQPSGVWEDAYGFWIADYDNSRVLQWNTIPASLNVPPDHFWGQISSASNSPGTSLANESGATLSYPSDVFSDSDYEYVVDSNCNRVLCFSHAAISNTQSALFALGLPDLATCGSAEPIRGCSDGRYVAIYGAGNLSIYDKTLGALGFGRMPDYTIPLTTDLEGAMTLASGYLYVSNMNSRTIAVYDLSALPSLAPLMTFNTTDVIARIAIKDGMLWYAALNSYAIKAVPLPTSSGSLAAPVITLGGSNGVSQSQLGGGLMWGLFVGNDNVAVSDTTNNRVLIYHCGAGTGVNISAAMRHSSSVVRPGTIRLKNGILAYPNPAHDRLQVAFELDVESSVRVAVYSLTGDCVAQKEFGELGAGPQEAHLNLSGLASGIYLAIVQARASDGAYHIWRQKIAVLH